MLRTTQSRLITSLRRAPSPAISQILLRIRIRRWAAASLIIRKGDNAAAERAFTAVIHKEEALLVAECPEIGTVIQGYPLKETVANLRPRNHILRNLCLREVPGLS